MQNTSFFTLFLLLLVTFSLSCCKEDPPTPEPPCMEDGLPCLTTEGKNMFACKVNGQPWIAETPYSIGGPVPISGEYNPETGWLYIKGTLKNETVYQSMNFFGQEIYEETVYAMYSEGQEGLTNYIGSLCDFEHRSNRPGEINIAKLDLEQRIIAGYFSMTLVNETCTDSLLTISNGRFDFNF